MNPYYMRMSTVAALLLLLLPSAPSAAADARNDPLLDEQWGLHRINATEAWDVAQGKGVRVAVIDSGVDLQHPDLRGRVATRAGLNLLDRRAIPDDDNGHGTHVAGIIAATANNGAGIAGVAPKAKIVPIKACDASGFCDDLDIADGIRHAIEAKADVINLSLGLGLVTGKVGAEAEDIRAAVEAAHDAGIVVIAAAGNLSLPLCQEPGSYVVCVGAIGPDDQRSYYSNGDASLTVNYLVAPGGDGRSALGSCDGEIVSTYIETESGCPEGDGYARLTGTSMAAPHVAGVAALLVSRGLDAERVVTTLLESAEDLGAPGRDPIFGYGLVDARAALSTAD